LIHSLLRSKKAPHADKAAPFACGENVAAERKPISINTFEFTAAFLMFDVIAIMPLSALILCVLGIFPYLMTCASWIHMP